MKNVLRSAFAIAFIIIAQNLFAQLSFKGCIVAEGNNFGAPGNLVKMAHYYPVSKEYVYFDSLAGDFTNGVLCDSTYTYIHVGNADASKDSIYKYNSNCHIRMNSAHVAGLQSMKCSASKLIVSKAFGADSNYIEIFDKNTLVKLAEISEVDEMCNGIAINGNYAYVAVNGSWPNYTDSGTIAVIDLTTNSFVNYIKLDTNAKAVNRVYSKGNKLWCECDFDKIVEYDLVANSFTIYTIGAFQNTVGLYGDYIAIAGFTGITGWNTVTHTMLLTDSYIGDVSEFRLNPLDNNQHFIIYNDYANNLATFVYSYPVVNRLDSFKIGIASMLDALLDNNEAPLVNASYNVRIRADFDTSFAIVFGDNDLCEVLTPKIISGPHRIGASATIDSFGNFHYTPAIGLVADDTVIVSILDAAGATANSTIYIHVYDLIGIENNLPISFSFYPNPSADILNLNLGNSTAESVEIIDMLGNIVLKNSLTSINQIVNISTLNDGYYLLRVSNSTGEQATRKFFKN